MNISQKVSGGYFFDSHCMRRLAADVGGNYH